MPSYLVLKTRRVLESLTLIARDQANQESPLGFCMRICGDDGIIFVTRAGVLINKINIKLMEPNSVHI